MNRIEQIGFSDPSRAVTATEGLVSHGETEPRSEYPPAEGRPVGAAMGGASCVAGAMRGEARSGLATNLHESTRTEIRENPCQSVAKTSPRFYAHDGNKNVSEAVAAAILSMINNFLGHIPGSSPIDYPFVSPRECVCNGEAAEEACSSC